MYNKDLFKKIVSVTCSGEELEKFNTNINKKQFDLHSAFEKYYSLQSVLRAINRYENGEVTDKYLANWMNAYNWIIMAGFKGESDNFDLKEWVKLEISDWLDSFSFYDSVSYLEDINEFKQSLTLLNGIY